MPADAFWTLAMACNVYLTFYFKFDARRLRKMEIPYLLLCYGIPFVIALALAFVSTPEKGHMYGNATLWCWISPAWDIYRVATFYGPVWVVVLITIFMYLRAGRDIYKKHKQLREFSTSHHDPDPLAPGLDDLFSSVKTTEVFVTTEAADKGNAIDLGPLGAAGAADCPGSQVSDHPKPPNAAYSVTISARQRGEPQAEDLEPPIQSNNTNDTLDTRITAGSTAKDRTAAGKGTRHPITTTTTTSSGVGGNNNNPHGLRRRAAWEANNATWSYAKCAILFFTAMLVTWIPSSANRVYSLAHAGHASLALEYMSAFVLPLQGLWNAIIYVVTSWGACRTLWDDIRSWWSRGGRRNRGLGMRMGTSGGAGGGGGDHGDLVRHHHHSSSRLHRSGLAGMGLGRSAAKAHDSKMYETESMTELAGASRPGSASVPTPPGELMVHGAKGEEDR
ncbi:hypothetical protein VTK26DRAFT_7683 [Humicola hyalothermophila]